MLYYTVHKRLYIRVQYRACRAVHQAATRALWNGPSLLDSFLGGTCLLFELSRAEIAQA
jgi:hypothetical protein